MSGSDANPLSGHGRVGTHRHAPVRPRGPQQAPRTRRSNEIQGKPAHRRTGRRVEARRFAARRMLFCGGGTGGHLYPGIEVARELAELAPGSTIVFAGTGREVEVRALEETPFEHRVLSAPRLPQGLGSALSFPWKAAAAYRQARRLLSEVNPNAVVGLGGYASFPPAIAAVRMGIPLVLLEQNAVPGRVTRMMAHHAREVLSPFPGLEHLLAEGARVHLSGNPVRRSVKERVHDAHEHLGLSSHKQTLLVLGGSQGAQGLNRAVLANMDQLAKVSDRVQVIHLTGAAQEIEVRRAYRCAKVRAVVAAFRSDMASLYEAADLALCRAGGTTIAELRCRELPAVLVPYPHAAGQHQHRNAEAASADRGAWVREEHELGARGFGEVIELLLDRSWLEFMGRRIAERARPDAGRSIALRLLGDDR